MNRLVRPVVTRRDVLAGLAALVVTRARLARADAATQVLGRFGTTYLHDAEHRPRAFNVELAADAIDGRANLPGAVFSFNAVVGERTAAFGFEKSVVLRNRMLAEGTGGGTCQVASTLHAAALLAGLTVISRSPHSRPSAYIRMGLDATVAYPSIDLKLQNPGPERLTLRARAVRGAIDVWLEGAGPRPDVTVTSEILERTPFPRTIERDPRVPGFEVHVKAHGIPGYRVQRTRVASSADGNTRRETHVDLYEPTPEALLVAPDFDVARLDGGGPDDMPAPVVRDEVGALRPVLVQLRPSPRVTLDNRS